MKIDKNDSPQITNLSSSVKIGAAENRKIAALKIKIVRCSRYDFNKLSAINFLSSIVSWCVQYASIKFIRPISIAYTCVTVRASI